MKKTVSTVLVSTLVFFVWVPVVSLAASFFYVDDAGNVGIGNSNPQTRLDVSGAIYSRLITASSTSINWAQGNVQSLTLTSSPTLTFSNGQAGGEYKLILTQDSTGNRTVTWPGNVKWSGGAPVLSTASSSIDEMRFVYDGSNYLGDYSLNYGASVPIARDGSFQWATTGSASSLSFSYTVPTTGDTLLVTAHPDTTTDDVTSVTWNGNAMTQVASVISGCTGGTSVTYLYKLENATAGTGNVVINVSPNRQIDGSAQAYSGVGSIDTSTSGCSDNAPNPSLTSSVGGDWYVSGVGISNSYVSAISGATRLNSSNQQAEMWDSNGSIGSAGSHSFGYTASNGANVSHIDVLLKPR